MGSAGDSPAESARASLQNAIFIGPNRCSRSVRRVAERLRRVACATRSDFSNPLYGVKTPYRIAYFFCTISDQSFQCPLVFAAKLCDGNGRAGMMSRDHQNQ